MTRRAAFFTVALNSMSVFMRSRLLVHRASFSLAVVEDIMMSFPASIASLYALESEPA